MTDRFPTEGIPRPPRMFYQTAHLREIDALHAALADSLFNPK
ncbi:MAG: hypothetical protein R2881_01465 [Eubacteriales bacterium]